MPQFLPLRANLEWLKKRCKQRLTELRATRPDAQLSEVQFAVAREFGFASWRKMEAHIREVRSKLAQLVPGSLDDSENSATIPPADADLVRLFDVIRTGNYADVQLLLRRRPALARARNERGATPLHAAAEQDDPQLAVMLLAFGADPEETLGGSGHTALSWALTVNSFSFANVLVRLGQAPDLFCAAGLGLLDEVQAFFDERGELSPGAARTGSSRYSSNGKRLPCPPATPNEQICDALYFSCRCARPDVARWLLTKSPDLDFRAFMGGTALHWAYFGGSREIIDALLHAGAKTDSRDYELHCTPRAFGLFAAARWGVAVLVERQLKADPSLATIMDGGTTALHEAARGGNADAIRALRSAGADPYVRDKDGRTPQELARDGHEAAVVALLAPET